MQSGGLSVVHRPQSQPRTAGRQTKEMIPNNMTRRIIEFVKNVEEKGITSTLCQGSLEVKRHINIDTQNICRNGMESGTGKRG